MLMNCTTVVMPFMGVHFCMFCVCECVCMCVCVFLAVILFLEKATSESDDLERHYLPTTTSKRYAFTQITTFTYLLLHIQQGFSRAFLSFPA